MSRQSRILVVIGIAAAALVLVRYWPRPPLSDAFSSSRAVYDRNGRLLRLTLSADEKYRLWTPLPSISPDLVKAVLLHEDQYFTVHPGVNPLALVRAATRTYTGGARQGGSTITMQLARLIERRNTKTAWGKVLQIATALRLEVCYSKAQILEAYLNLAPYGQNIEGVGAASLIYLNRAPQQLTLAEALTLAVIPQSPARRALRDEARKTLIEARNRLYGRWSAHYRVAAEQQALLQLPLNLRNIGDLPFRAPHATAMLLADQSRPGGDAVITSTLDLKMQQVLERQLQNYVARERRLGIVNASAMLVDTRDMGVRAVVGSADFFDAAIDGQVNGTLARRSPGSTLKPFIYALALDQGLLHPMTVLKDAPTAFGPFSPENFDGRFAGPITVHDALIRSRNVPAVATSARLSQPTLYQFLKNAGVARMQSERHYGLGLALGGGEITMEEMVRLYAMLANRGISRPLRYVTERKTADAHTDGSLSAARQAAQASDLRLLSEEASFIVMDILRDNPRPDFAFSATTRLPVAWKTGTSWGFRDAWTAGIFGPYVLVVWIGNFDGEGNPSFVGVQAAAPLFFQIIDAIVAQHPGLTEPALRQPANLRRIEVCAASGDLPNAECPLRAQTWFIPGKSPIKVSTLHRTVVIDTRTGRAVCSSAGSQSTRTEVFEFWPSDLAQLFVQAGMPRRQPPAQACFDDVNPALAPVITSPLRATTYTQRSAGPAQTIALNAVAEADADALHWFANDAYLGSSKPGVALGWQPVPGTYVLRVVDQHGRSDARSARVELVD